MTITPIRNSITAGLDAPLRLGALLCLLLSGHAWSACTDVDLDAQSLDSALLRIGRDAGVSVLYQREFITRHTIAASAGDDDCARLIRKLLTGTLLELKVLSGDVYVVRPAPAPRAAAEGPVEQVPADARRVPTPNAGWLEEIRVYGRSSAGSRLRNMGLDGTAQVDIIDHFEIERSGRQTLSEVLRFLPAVAGNAASTYVTNGGDGTATITLRGLPSSHTLVLLNGRRLNTDALSGASVDLNTIPLAAVERVEVLKDGASAIHGSDAIAGVVNIVTRQGLSGLHMSSYAGMASRDDLQTQHHSILFGHQGARHGVLIGAEFYDQQDIASRDRAISRSSDDRARGGIDRRSSATAPARVSLVDGPVVLDDGVLGSASSDYRAATDEDRFEYRDFTTALVPSQRHSLFAEGQWDLNERLTLFGEALHTRTDSASTLAPVPLFTGFEALDLSVAADAAFNPFDVDIGDVRRRIVELPPREQRNRTDTDRLVLGIRATGTAWNLEVHASRHETRAREDMANILAGPNVQLAVGPEEACSLDPACLPLNLFGPPGSIDPGALAYVATRSRSRGDSSLATFAVTGVTRVVQLPAGPLEVAAGFEWREERLRVTPDPRAAEQLLVGGANFGATRGEREVAEIHAEVVLPLASGRKGLRQLDLQLADRFSDYSDFGTTHNPKIALRWRPLADLLVRFSWGMGFRAPTLRELHLSVQQSAAFLVDPCARAEQLALLPGCVGQADPTLNQFLTLQGGNEDLKAEQARNQTLGMVWTPGQVPGDFALAIDVYDIEQENVVDSSAQFVVDENAATGRFADRIQRDAAGNLQIVEATNLNIGQRELRGMDLALDWRLPPHPLGLVELALKASHINSFVDQLDPAMAPVERAGTFQDAASEGNGALPDWKVNLGVTLVRGRWETRYGVHHVTGLDEEVPLLGTRRTIGAWTIHNVQLGYRWHAPVGANLALGVQNLLDRAPPFAASAFNDSYDSRTHDLIGRFLYARASLQF